MSSPRDRTTASPIPPSTRRLRILTPTEIDDLYTLKSVSDAERYDVFTLYPAEQSLFARALPLTAQIDAILRLGYFKRMGALFPIALRNFPEDIQHIMTRYFPSATLDKMSLGRNARLRNQHWVLRVTGYTRFNQAQHGILLRNKAAALCRLSSHPVLMMRALLAEVAEKKITRPRYSTFQNIIAAAFISEQQRIAHVFSLHLSPLEHAAVFQLLEQQGVFYAVTLLKQQPKNFKPTAIRQEMQHYERHQTVYHIAQRIIPLLDISKNAVAYYASLVEHYSVRSLRRTQSSQTCLWLLCFIQHRCQRMMDNLVTMFIYTANHYQRDVTQRAEALWLQHTLAPDAQKKTLAQLIRVYTDTTMDENQPFSIVKKHVYDTILSAERINAVANTLDNPAQQKIVQTPFTWEAVDACANTYRSLLRALVKIVILEGPQHATAQHAYAFLQNSFKKEQPILSIPGDQFPLEFINTKIKDFIYNKETKKMYIDRYEYECYRTIANYINGRSLFVNASIHYQSLAAELLPQWTTTKTAVLEKINNPILNTPFSQFIEEKAKPLDAKIIAVHEAITAGHNDYVKLKKNKEGETVWTLPYTPQSLELNNPLYQKLPSINIIRILQFVNEKTQYIQKFTHIKSTYAKSERDTMEIYACLIANGTNLGLLKMKDLCDLAISRLDTTEKNYIRLATLRAANDTIGNAIALLPIFRHWNFQPDLLHASLDGQKFVTEWDNVLSRYSQKYFGFNKGVVAYSLIANHIPINTMIIGANEHESRFFFDLIYNTTSDIQPDIFSTDTEGSNKLNFLLLHLIGRLYAPRYRSFGHKTQSIISYSDPSQFKHCLIKPHHQLNEALILSEEDNIQHILASLLMGETKQSNVIAKLSSPQLASRTKRALWEMNAVLMSDHLLNYMCDVTFRQSIQRALCRGEAYHQLRRHIEKVNGRHFRAVNETQISEWNECARLLAHCILYYNASMLNAWMERSDALGETQKSAWIKHLSPVAWTHVTFHGKYEFLPAYETIDLDGWLADMVITEADFNKKLTKSGE